MGRMFFGAEILGIHQLRKLGDFRLIILEEPSEGIKSMLQAIGINTYDFLILSAILITM